MWVAASRPTLDGAILDPTDRHRCFIFDAIAAVALPEILGAGVGAEVAGLGAGIGAGEVASITLPEVLATAAAPTAFSVGEAAIPGALGALGGAEAGGALNFGSSLGEALGGAGLPAGFSAGGGVLLPTTGATTPGSITPISATPNPTASAVGGPTAAAPTAPASVTDIPGTTSGNLAETFGGTKDVAAGGAGDVTGSTGTSGLRASVDKGLNSLTGGFLDSKDLGSALSVGGLGMNILNRNQPIPGQKQLSNAASSLSATAAAQANRGAELEGYLQSGTLPPGLAAGVRSATEAAKAKIKSQYASRGQAGSSAEAQDIQAAEDRALTASQDVALSLLQQGSSMVSAGVTTEGLASSIYQQIMNDALARDNQLGSAIGSFSSALAGSGSGNTVTLKAA